MTKKSVQNHPCYTQHIKKLNRVIGQLEGVKRMIEDRRYCADILTQTRAAASALKSIEIAVLESHLTHCVSDAMASNSHTKAMAKVEELVGLVRRF